MSTRETASTGFSSKPHACQPGSIRLQQFLMQTFGVANSGCFSATSVLSSGRPSWHQYGKAVDLGSNYNDAAGRARGDRVFDWVLLHKEELNLQQMIWGHRIYDISYGGVRTYSHSDHENHVHVAIGYQASQTWRFGTGTTPIPSAPAPPIDEDQMDTAQEQRVVGGIQDGQKYAANQIITAIKPLLDQVETLLTQTNALLVEVRQETAAVKRNTAPAP